MVSNSFLPALKTNKTQSAWNKTVIDSLNENVRRTRRTNHAFEWFFFFNGNGARDNIQKFNVWVIASLINSELPSNTRTELKIKMILFVLFFCSSSQHQETETLSAQLMAPKTAHKITCSGSKYDKIDRRFEFLWMNWMNEITVSHVL